MALRWAGAKGIWTDSVLWRSVALIEGHGVGTSIKLDGLSPDQALLVVESGDHQVVGAGGNAGKRSAAIGVSACGGDHIGLHGIHGFLAIGRAVSAKSSYIFVWRDASGHSDADFCERAGVAVAE